MTFNWPDIPFSGTEVDAFVAEYKALAQTIYDEWDDDGEMRIYDFDPSAADLPIPLLKAPFRRRSTIKILLENGLLYAAFIVKQRAGNSGPGTDFDLGNSPLSPSMTVGERYELFSNLGCVFTPEAMECAHRKNNNGKNPPVDLGDPYNILGDGGIPDSDVNPDDPPNIPTNNPDDPPDDCPNKNLRENAFIGLMQTPGPLSSCFRDIKSQLLDRYLSCDGSVFNENDIPNKLPNLRDAVQEFFDLTADGQRQFTFRGSYEKRLNITSAFSSEGLARMGVGAGQKVHRVSFYTDPGRRLCLHTLFGTALVITTSSEQVLRILDDFDFAYGNQANRPDASHTGQPNPGQTPGPWHTYHQRDRDNNAVPIGDPTAVGSTVYPPVTEISDVQGTQSWMPTEVGRNIIVDNFLNGDGKGQPVPININLQ